MNSEFIEHDIVLVGGGHSHALLIRQWAMQPLQGIRLTLVSRDVLTPYSGMLPGLIAGHYEFDAVHLDLRHLCSWAGVRFVEAELTSIDLNQQSIGFQNRPSIEYDVLSLDTGSTPELEVPGSTQFTVPVKPVNTFYDRWRALQLRIENSPDTIDLGVVGAGAGGFELIMAMRHALPAQQCRCHWFLRGTTAINERTKAVGAKALAAANRFGIVVHTDFDVIEVRANQLHSSDGRDVSLDEIIWCTGATAPSWPTAAGLNTDQRGFIETTATLQSTSHPMVFASGDIGSLAVEPNAKAGVYAVRQAPVLFHNLRAFIRGQKLKRFRPQSDFLSLMATGKKSGIANRGKWVLEGGWVWRWKHAIDSKFMNKFRNLKPRGMLMVAAAQHTEGNSNNDPQMHCSGCGSKVGWSDLSTVLNGLEATHSSDVVTGLDARDDIASFKVVNGIVVQSVDHLREIIDDPYTFGRIAALHAMSDVFTATDKLISAQALVTVPFAASKISRRTLRLLLAGSIHEFNRAGCPLIGGHTAEGLEQSLGFVVNGQGIEDDIDVAVDPGDCLILTQCLGIGVLFAGLMQAKAKGVWIQSAIAAMLQSNQLAAAAFRAHGVVAITDVTGFGLLNHATALLHRTTTSDNKPPLKMQINASALPILPGAMNLAESGVKSTLLAKNIESLALFRGLSSQSIGLQTLCSDPQTSGGLLAIVPASKAADALASLRARGYKEAAIVGSLIESDEHRIVS